eukprot:15355736-Ditylum_brightwellii.AAC.1
MLTPHTWFSDYTRKKGTCVCSGNGSDLGSDDGSVLDLGDRLGLGSNASTKVGPEGGTNEKMLWGQIQGNSEDNCHGFKLIIIASSI